MSARSAFPITSSTSGPLSDDEWQPIKEHPKKGFELVGGLIHPEAGEAVLANHERWDGDGYPRGLREEEIPLLARVLLVADAYVAMTVDRPFLAADPGSRRCRPTGSFG